MTHISMLSQPGNTRLYFAIDRVMLRLLNVADSAVRVRVLRSGLRLLLKNTFK